MLPSTFTTFQNNNCLPPPCRFSNSDKEFLKVVDLLLLVSYTRQWTKYKRVILDYTHFREAIKRAVFNETKF